MAERLMQDGWTGPRGRSHSRVLIVAEHVGLKPRINTDKDAAEDGAEKAAEDAKAVNHEPENSRSCQFLDRKQERFVGGTWLLPRPRPVCQQDFGPIEQLPPSGLP